MLKPKHMNKRKAKKWRKYCDDSSWVYFMCGGEPKTLTDLRKLIQLVDREFIGGIYGD